MASLASTEAGGTILSWSGGKDSALALWQLRQLGAAPCALLTTVTQSYGRISMHGVREELLDRQARALGLPLFKVRIPAPCPNDEYARLMAAMIHRLRRDGVHTHAFGDLYLADVRAYRERQLAAASVRARFPLWGMDTRWAAARFLELGFCATVVTVDPRALPRTFAGRPYDAAFLRDLPPGVDPCGENGEFHTFVHGGPLFARPLAVRRGEIVERDGFVFCDLLPGAG